MDHKKSPKGKKRQSKQIEDTLWECSACTYRNNPEAFKCSMCSIRKGTSTRKPKLNPDMVEVQVQKHAFTPPSPHIRFPREELRGAEPPAGPYSDDAEEAGPSTSSAPKAKKPKTAPATPKPPRTPKTPGTTGGAGSRGKLKNVDRKNATVHSVTVDNVTISITEYKLKPRKEKGKGGGGEGAAAAASSVVSDADSDTQESSSQNLESFQGTRSS